MTQVPTGTIKLESAEINLRHLYFFLYFFLNSPSDFNLQPELNASRLKGSMIKVRKRERKKGRVKGRKVAGRVLTSE